MIEEWFRVGIILQLIFSFLQSFTFSLTSFNSSFVSCSFLSFSKFWTQEYFKQKFKTQNHKQILTHITYWYIFIDSLFTWLNVINLNLLNLFYGLHLNSNSSNVEFDYTWMSVNVPIVLFTMNSSHHLSLFSTITTRIRFSYDS